MATLVVVDAPVPGPKEGDSYPLGKRTTVIGRQETCAFQLVDDAISRKHLQIRYEPGDARYYALDMNSANGTVINGTRIQGDVALNDGDVIRIGGTTIEFTLDDAPDLTSAVARFKQRDQRGQPTIGQ